VGGTVTIGVLRRPHGLNGEIVLTDFTAGTFVPGPGTEITLLGPSDHKTVVVERWRRRGEDALAKFAGVDGREEAEAFREWRAAVPPEVLPPPPEGAFFEFELLGLPVETSAGEPLGEVVEIYAAGPHDVLVVRDGGLTREVPFVRAHVAEVRRGEKIVIAPYREE
jgi:16S rRNA processing protein RimM